MRFRNLILGSGEKYCSRIDLIKCAKNAEKTAHAEFMAWKNLHRQIYFTDTERERKNEEKYHFAYINNEFEGNEFIESWEKTSGHLRRCKEVRWRFEGYQALFRLSTSTGFLNSPETTRRETVKFRRQCNKRQTTQIYR